MKRIHNWEVIGSWYLPGESESTFFKDLVFDRITIFGECLYSREWAKAPSIIWQKNGVGCVGEGNKELEGAGGRG